MENRFIVRTKTKSSLRKALRQLKQIEGVEIEKLTERKNKTEDGILSLAGLWRNRKIDPDKLRKEAWLRKKG